MATRFVLSTECDVSEKFKQHYLSAKKEDIVIFQSPVGLPGRAIRTPLVSKVLDDTIEFFKCQYQCMKKCSYRFCIIQSLINAQKGDIDNAVVFSGENVWKMKEILPVKEIFNKLINEADSVPEGEVLA